MIGCGAARMYGCVRKISGLPLCYLCTAVPVAVAVTAHTMHVVRVLLVCVAPHLVQVVKLPFFSS